MYRQCDMQNEHNQVLRGWIPVDGAREGVSFKVRGYDGWFTVTRVHQFGISDEGLTEMQNHFRKWKNNI